MLCFLDTERTPGIVLRVSLTDVLQPTSVAPHTSILQDENQMDLADAIVEEAPLCENPPTSTITAPYTTTTIVEEAPLCENPPTSTITAPYTTTTFITPGENPFNITDAEIDEIIKVLEGGSVLPNQTPVNIDYDEDLEKVLSMDVGDFIV